MDVEKLIERIKCPQIHSCPMDGEYPSCAACQKSIKQEAADALSELHAENEKLRAELERMKKIMRDNGIMVIPSNALADPALELGDAVNVGGVLATAVQTAITFDAMMAICLNDIGKTVFLTREEAEAALATDC